MKKIQISVSLYKFYTLIRELYAEECQIPTKRLVAQVAGLSVDEVRARYEQLIDKELVKVTKYGLCLNFDRVSIEVNGCE